MRLRRSDPAASCAARCVLPGGERRARGERVVVVAQRVERRQRNRPVGGLHRDFALAAKRVQHALEQPGHRFVRVGLERAVVALRSGARSRCMWQWTNPSIASARAHSGSLSRARRGMHQGGARFLLQIGRHAPGHAQDVPLGEPGARRRQTRMAFDEVIEQGAHALEIGARRPMHERDRADLEGETLERRQRLCPRTHHLESLDGTQDAFDQALRQLAVRIDQIAHGHRDPVAPDDLGAARVDELARRHDLVGDDAEGAGERVGGAESGSRLAHHRGPVAQRARRQARDDAQAGVARQTDDHRVGDQLADRRMSGIEQPAGERDHRDRDLERLFLNGVSCDRTGSRAFRRPCRHEQAGRCA